MSRQSSDRGFSLVELMIVVLIIGILVAMAVPVYAQSKETATRRTCFANQRTLAGAIFQYSTRSNGDLTPIVGLIDGDHPFIDQDILYRPPTCPSAGRPGNTMMPTAAEGAYSVTVGGQVAACTFGTPAHGRFD